MGLGISHCTGSEGQAETRDDAGDSAKLVLHPVSFSFPLPRGALAGSGKEPQAPPTLPGPPPPGLKKRDIRGIAGDRPT